MRSLLHSGVSEICVELERRAGELIATPRTLNASPCPRNSLEARIRNARLAHHARRVLSGVQTMQCSFDLHDGLKVAFQISHGDLTAGTSGSDASFVVRVGVDRQFLAGPRDAVLKVFQFGKQTLPKDLEVADILVLVLLCVCLSFHCRNRSHSARLHGASTSQEVKEE